MEVNLLRFCLCDKDRNRLRYNEVNFFEKLDVILIEICY